MDKISIETLYTPYTLDTYSIFTMESAIESEMYYYNDENDTDIELEYDDIECDMDGYLKALADNLIDQLNDNIKDKVLHKFSYDGKVISPKEYNFVTDKIFIDIEYDKKELDKYIDKHKTEYEKEKIESRDGFIWLGDEDLTRIAYYITRESTKKLSKNDYIMNQFDDVSDYEYITIKD